MKTFTFSGYGVQSQTFQYGFHMTSHDLAAAVGLSVVQIEAMTEDEVKALMLEHKQFSTKRLMKARPNWIGPIILNIDCR
jgi:hypothetical protein